MTEREQIVTYVRNSCETICRASWCLSQAEVESIRAALETVAQGIEAGDHETIDNG